jgi:uncharacterized spore protein YtfJ
MSGLVPWKTELIEGDPVQIDGRQLIPVVKVRSMLRRQVTFGTAASSGGGGGLVWLQPVAVIERQSDGSEERFPITDEAGMAVRGMLIGAMVLPILYLFIASAAFLWRRSRSNR